MLCKIYYNKASMLWRKNWYYCHFLIIQAYNCNQIDCQAKEDIPGAWTMSIGMLKDPTLLALNVFQIWGAIWRRGTWKNDINKHNKDTQKKRKKKALPVISLCIYAVSLYLVNIKSRKTPLPGLSWHQERKCLLPLLLKWELQTNLGEISTLILEYLKQREQAILQEKQYRRPRRTKGLTCDSMW